MLVRPPAWLGVRKRAQRRPGPAKARGALQLQARTPQSDDQGVLFPMPCRNFSESSCHHKGRQSRGRLVEPSPNTKPRTCTQVQVPDT